MAKVLITGATGFIGNHVTRLCLEQGDEVRVMVMPGGELVTLTERPILLYPQGDNLVEDNGRNTKKQHTRVHSAALVLRNHQRQPCWGKRRHARHCYQ